MPKMVFKRRQRFFFLHCVYALVIPVFPLLSKRSWFQTHLAQTYLAYVWSRRIWHTDVADFRIPSKYQYSLYVGTI